VETASERKHKKMKEIRETSVPANIFLFCVEISDETGQHSGEVRSLNGATTALRKAIMRPAVTGGFSRNPSKAVRRKKAEEEGGVLRRTKQSQREK
jgi:hypothetical protein